MNITEFHQAAREAVHGVSVKTSIEQCSGDHSATYKAITTDGGECCHGNSTDPAEAIRKLVADRARNRAEKIEAAKKLLDSIG